MARIFVCGDTGLPELLTEVADALREHGHEVIRGPADVAGATRCYGPKECASLIADSDIAVFTVRHECSRDLMAAARRLRGICYPTIGVETLDLDAANALGIIVGHGAVRGNVIGMAESTVMLMLMLLYEVESNILRMRSGKWRRAGHHSRQMHGKIIGLIGFGRIAREVALRLAPFGVKILTFSPRLRAEHLPDGVAKVDLVTLLRESDVVTVLTGLTAETRQMIDARMLALMKRSSYLVNTGRGAVIEEAALFEALRDRKIAGAALDTFEAEPLSADSPLRTLANVILTPHCVGHTIEGWAEFAPAMIANIERILGGELPLYCKNPEAEQAWRARLQRLDA